jgi:hypothetical protein
MTRGRSGGRIRLAVPAALLTALGCDAVGVSYRDGYQLMRRLPEVGCVFADRLRWWWIVPSGSNLGLAWPATAVYAVGAWVPAAPAGGGGMVAPRLIHWPAGGVAYTPPIPLYFMICRLAGETPPWSRGTRRAVAGAGAGAGAGG